jgi:hypothetical protein
MRCLGRLVLLVILVLAVSAGYFYRTELVRWGRGVLDPITIERRTGRPSAEAMASVERKLAAWPMSDADSLLLTASELASLVVRGAEGLGLAGLDSTTVELGDRTIRVRTLIPTSRLPERWREMLPGDGAPYEEVIAHGTLTPVRPGLAEWQLEQVLVRGLPLPSDLVGRVLGRVTGRASDGRLEMTLPSAVRGFRVRPEGVAIYRSER